MEPLTHQFSRNKTIARCQFQMVRTTEYVSNVLFVPCFRTNRDQMVRFSKIMRQKDLHVHERSVPDASRASLRRTFINQTRAAATAKGTGQSPCSQLQFAMLMLQTACSGCISSNTVCRQNAHSLRRFLTAAAVGETGAASFDACDVASVRCFVLLRAFFVVGLLTHNTVGQHFQS